MEAVSKFGKLIQSNDKLGLWVQNEFNLDKCFWCYASSWQDVTAVDVIAVPRKLSIAKLSPVSYILRLTRIQKTISFVNQPSNPRRQEGYSSVLEVQDDASFCGDVSFWFSKKLYCFENSNNNSFEEPKWAVPFFVGIVASMFHENVDKHDFTITSGQTSSGRRCSRTGVIRERHGIRINPWSLEHRDKVLGEPNRSTRSKRRFYDYAANTQRRVELHVRTFEFCKSSSQNWFSNRYSVFLSTDGQYGESDKGIFTGVIGDIQGNIVDISVSDVVLTYSRNTVVDFTTPYFYDVDKIITQVPVERIGTTIVFDVLHYHVRIYLATYLKKFAKCFSQTWLLLLAFLLVVWLLMSLVFKVRGDFGSNFLNALAPMINQSSTPHIDRLPKMVLFGTWLIASVILTCKN